MFFFPKNAYYITITTTASFTTTSGTALTSIVFKPGNPPAAKLRREVDLKRDATPTVPAYIKNYAPSAISSACSCLDIPTPTPSSITTTTKTLTTTVTVAPPVVTSTIYPCATPVPTLIPTVPFGNPNYAVVGDTANELYGSGTPGETIEGCCNLCYFGVQNCILAVFYGYQGCVVIRPSVPVGTGIGLSDVCPVGQFAGLIYSRDTTPPFRSQGDIAGPCGQVYNNL